MGLTETDVTRAADLLRAAGSTREAIVALRTAFPSVRALTVDAADMRGESPAVQAGARALFLVASDGHCWTVTNRAAEAAAFVLTES